MKTVLLSMGLTCLLAFSINAEEVTTKCHKVKRDVLVGSEDPKEKVFCNEVVSKEDLEKEMPSKEEYRIYRCLKSVATNKKSFGIVPFGKNGDDLYEVKDKSPLADPSKKEHLVVDVKKKKVEKCRVDGRKKKCATVNWSKLKDVLRQNIAIEKAKPMKKIDEHFEKEKKRLVEKEEKLKVDLDEVNKETENSALAYRNVVQKCCDRDQVKKDKKKRAWKRFMKKKFGFKESDFGKEDKLKAISKEKLLQAMREEKEEAKKKKNGLAAKKLASKKRFKEKMENVAAAKKPGKDYCQDIGLKKFVSNMKEPVLEEEGTSRGTATSSK